jgi:hypothetical protein
MFYNDVNCFDCPCNGIADRSYIGQLDLAWHRPLFAGGVVDRVALPLDFLRVLQFSLPVSFDQFSIFLFHSSAIDGI